MFRHSSPLTSLALGLLVTLGQVGLAVGFANPEGSLRDRYLTLVQHDSYWFANIIDRGYGTTLPPVDHKEMEVSNVAFFPAYPLLAGIVKRGTGLGTYPALLVTAQAATVGFWTYFFLFAACWRLPVSLQLFGVLAIVAHPAAFYLVAGYSESLFLMTLAGFIYWSTSEGRGANGLAVLHGIAMSATRIVGLPCAAFPVVHALCKKSGRSNQIWRDWIARYRAPVLIMMLSTFGGLAFFAYCQVRWGRWDLYMLTQESGWAIEADYLAIFKPGNYHFALPPLYDSTRASQFASDPRTEQLAQTHRLLLCRRCHLLYLAGRRRLRAARKHAPIRSLCARPDRSCPAPLSAGIPPTISLRARVGDRTGRARFCSRTRAPGILCLELHAGKLGRLRWK
jgi:hypothetical protein